MTKKIMLLLVVITFIAAGCKKQVSQDCIRARIIRITCASTVMQALDNNAVGEDNWADITNNNKSYDNVFGISNSCKIPSTYKTGDTAYIIIAKPATSDCVYCALYDAAPKTSYDINSITSTPCENEMLK